MSEWQPIETAPKDGQMILLRKGEEVALGWHTKDKHYPWAFIDDNTAPGWLDEHYDGDILLIEPNGWHKSNGPTDWQPIPKPPK